MAKSSKPSLFVSFLVIVGLVGYFWVTPLLDEFGKGSKADNLFSPVIDDLMTAADENAEIMEQRKQTAAEEPPYDLDKTIRIMHLLDEAMETEGSVEGYLKTIAKQDYRDVAPDIIRARVDIVKILQEIYARELEMEESASILETGRNFLLSAMSVADASFNPLTGIGFDIDKSKAESELEKIRNADDRKRKVREELRDLENQLYSSMIQYSEAFFDVMEEWDALCLHRDAAYLAVLSGDWERVIREADRAMRLAPSDSESPILKAQALIELSSEVADGDGFIVGDSTPNTERERLLDEAQGVLDDYLEAFPGRSAPALQLLGALHAKRGNFGEARLSFQQAAAYYPRQATLLTDLLGPYQLRSFLRKSKEGRHIVETYQSTMLGAGYYSPDLQLARLHYIEGETAAGDAKVLDHFARRRAQGQLDYIISDLDYCYNYLGVDYFSIFPEQFYVDLQWSPSGFGYGRNVKLEVTNRSDVTLENVGLVLCVHFTDMFRGDYETYLAPESLTRIAPGETGDFGVLEIDTKILGEPKGAKDIVTARAVLISNDSVVWVDTQEFKMEELESTAELVAAARRETPELRERRQQEDLSGLWKQMSERVTTEQISDSLAAGEFRLEEKMFGTKSELNVSLPKELAMLQPNLKVRRGDGTWYELKESSIDNGTIQAIIDLGGALRGRETLELKLETRLGNILVDLEPKGEFGYAITSIRPSLGLGL